MPKPLQFEPTPKVDVLLIARDQIMRIYTDEVLNRSGFRVCSVPPWEARNLIYSGARDYPVVVFSHTLYPRDISEMAYLLHRNCPDSRLLLMLGPDSVLPDSDSQLFDGMLDGLDGPDALIQEVHRLAVSRHMSGSSNGGNGGNGSAGKLPERDEMVDRRSRQTLRDGTVGHELG